MSGLTGTHRGYRHAATGPIVAAATGSLVLAFSLSPAFAATTSALHLTAGSAPAAVGMQEAAPGTAACTSSALGTGTADTASCSGIDVYGGHTLQPGTASSTTVVFTNTGTGQARTFTASAGTCTQSAQGANSGRATDLCEKFQVRISAQGRTVFDGTAAEFGRTGALSVIDATSPTGIAAGESIAVTVTLTLSPTIDNDYAGLVIGQPITWTFQN